MSALTIRLPTIKYHASKPSRAIGNKYESADG